MPRQAGREPAKRALERAVDEQVELGQPHRAAASMCDSLVPQPRVAPGDVTCSKRALHPLKTLGYREQHGSRSANSHKGLGAEL